MKEKHIFYKDEGYEINYIIDNTDLEKEIKLEAEQSETKKVSVFLKHTSIGNNKVIVQYGYRDIIFDDTKNSVTIKKPIINEEFIIIIVVDSKGNLEKYTQCDFAFVDKSKIGKYSKTFTSVTSNFNLNF
jgi:hypothetical protein